MGTATYASTWYTAEIYSYAPPTYVGVNTFEILRPEFGNSSNLKVYLRDQTDVTINGVQTKSDNYIVTGDQTLKGLTSSSRIRTKFSYLLSKYADTSITPNYEVSSKVFVLLDQDDKIIQYFRGTFSTLSVPSLGLPKFSFVATMPPVVMPTVQTISYQADVPGRPVFKILNPTYTTAYQNNGTITVSFPINQQTVSGGTTYTAVGTISHLTTPSFDVQGNLKIDISTSTQFLARTTITWPGNTSTSSSTPVYPTVATKLTFQPPVLV